MSNKVTAGYRPEKLFFYFEKISSIPRGSGNEAEIAAYVEEFARERGLFCLRDKQNNVFIRAVATSGREDEAAVLLQGHMDMVCEKNSGTEHDFLRDGLDLYVENGWLRARGTTLGGDNGIAVAVMLAMLDSPEISHPTLECLFTVDEEVGLLGAGSFDYSNITAKKMINMDSEAEGSVIVGCAGGVRSELCMKYKTIPARGDTLKIALTGLAGGHSGENINLPRANATKLMGRILLTLAGKMRVNLMSLNGGTKDNAIPREATAVISVADASRAARAVLREVGRIRAELGEDDGGMLVVCDIQNDEGEESTHLMFDTLSTRRALAVIGSVQNGVIEMSRKIDGLVGFSRNLGITSTDESTNTLSFVFSSRSAVEAQLDASERSLDALAAVCGCVTRHYSRYPGWDYTRSTPLLEKYLRVARGIYGCEPIVRTIHAGLECGIIKSRLPRLDIISVGPDMKNIHSPDEALSLASCERFWTLICGLLA